MPPNPQPSGPVRSSACVNREIRELWADPSVPLTDEQRVEYWRLLAEWAVAVRAEVVEAA